MLSQMLEGELGAAYEDDIIRAQAQVFSEGHSLVVHKGGVRAVQVLDEVFVLQLLDTAWCREARGSSSTMELSSSLPTVIRLVMGMLLP